MTGGPDKGHGTNKPPPTGRVRERWKGDTACLPKSLWLASTLAERCVCHQERLWIGMIGHRPPGNESHHHKTRDCEPRGRAVLLVSLTYCSLPGCPFPIKSLALSAHVSPRTVHFWVLDKSPASGPGRGPPSYNNSSILAWRIPWTEEPGRLQSMG